MSNYRLGKPILMNGLNVDGYNIDLSSGIVAGQILKFDGTSIIAGSGLGGLTTNRFPYALNSTSLTDSANFTTDGYSAILKTSRVTATNVVGTIIDTTTNWTSTGSSVLSIRNNGSSIFDVQANQSGTPGIKLSSNFSINNPGNTTSLSASTLNFTGINPIVFLSGQSTSVLGPVFSATVTNGGSGWTTGNLVTFSNGVSGQSANTYKFSSDGAFSIATQSAAVVAGGLTYDGYHLKYSNDGTAWKKVGYMADWFDVRDYGAIGDGYHDDGYALSNALAACYAVGGGTVYFPPGTYRIADQVIIDGGGNHQQMIRVTGCGSASIIYMDNVSGNFDLITLKGIGHIEVDRLIFIGNPSRTVDVHQAGLLLYSCNYAYLHDCEFFGIESGAGGSVVSIVDCSSIVHRCNFLGNSGNIVLAVSSPRQVDLSDLTFIDFGDLGGVFYSKTGDGVNSWITVSSPTNNGDSVHTNQCFIKNISMDEGPGFAAIQVLGASGFPFERVEIQGINHLLGVSRTFIIEYTFDCKIKNYTYNTQAATRVLAELALNTGSLHLENWFAASGFSNDPQIYINKNSNATNTILTLERCEAIPNANIFAGDPLVYGAPSAMHRIDYFDRRSTLRLANATIAASQLVKLDGYSKYIPLTTSDSVSIAVGPSQTAATSGQWANAYQLAGQQVVVLNDGYGILNPGDFVTVSTSVAGRVKKATSGATCGVVAIGSAATADAVTEIIWEKYVI